MEEVARECNPQDVASTWWAYAKMGMKPGERALGVDEGTDGAGGGRRQHLVGDEEHHIELLKLPFSLVGCWGRRRRREEKGGGRERRWGRERGWWRSGRRRRGLVGGGGGIEVAGAAASGRGATAKAAREWP